MPEMKTLNGYEVVDAKARQDIKGIQAAVEAIPKYDLTPYATKSELPTKVSQLQNDSNFITSIPSEYVTESELNAKGYLTQEDLPGSIDTSRFLTKVDNNDQYMWYATTTNANQVIQNHVPIEKLDSKLDVVVGGKTLNNNTIAVREGLQIRVPEAPTNAGHAASKAYVDKAIAAIPGVDLSSYAKKTDIPDISHLAPKTSIPTKVSQLANDSNYLTSIPSEYVTESELNAKGYLTEHQSLAAYATKTYVDNTVAENQPDLSGYAMKTDIPDVSGFISEIPSEYVTDSELAAKGYLVEANLSEYAKKSEIPTVPTKTSQLTNDSNFLTAIPAEYITETELNNKGYLTQHQSLEGYATKSYVDTAVDDCKDVFFLDFSNATTSYLPADKQMKDLGERFFVMGKDDISVMIKDTQSNYFYPAIMDRQLENSRILFTPLAINLNTINGTTPCTWDVISLNRLSIGGQYEWQYCLIAQGSSTTIATKSYVDAAISALEARVAALEGGTK